MPFDARRIKRSKKQLKNRISCNYQAYCWSSADTYRVDGAKDLSQVLKKIQHVKEVSTEEFVDGREFTYDTVCVKGKPIYENVAEYLPRPLIARSNEWISPIIITVRDLNAPLLQPGLQLGRGVLKALNMGTGFTHMEWYLTDKGEVVFGEIGCETWRCTLGGSNGITSDIDLFREWARAVCYHDMHIKIPVCSTVQSFKRAQGQGKIRHIAGLQKLYAKKLVVLSWSKIY